MSDIRSPALLWTKAFLFLFLGLLAGALLLLKDPNLRTALLWAISVWAFCRFYYFAFYVIEHYLDDSYRFSGLGSFFVYTLRRKRRE